MKYIVKLWNLYADGKRGWTSRQSEAFVFTDGGDYFDTALDFALAHIATLNLFSRLVRLIPRSA